MTEIWQYWVSGGPLLIPIVLTCLGIWVYFLGLYDRMKKALSFPGGFEDEIGKRLAGSQGIEATIKWLSKFDDAVSRAISYTLKQKSAGKSIREAMEECHKAELSFFERETLILSSLVAAAPLLGLLGTVFGMVNTFQAVAGIGADTADLVAQGISQALITTQFGLIVALPGIFGVSYIKRKCSELEVRLSICESHLLLHFEGGALGSRFKVQGSKVRKQ